jgi:succinoglycan biosynthesis protein ExoM
LGLQRLLDELLSQSTDFSRELKPIIFVVDNSADGSAAWITKHDRYQREVTYNHCLEQGVSNSRNAALDFARSSSSPIAFIDDDELTNKLWLATAIIGVQNFENEILVGPVVPSFEEGVEPRKIPDSFWERKVRENNSIVTELVGGGNILFPARLIKAGLRFSPEFNLTGGEDTDFLIRSKSQGFKVRNLSDLSVFENVPLSRQTINYLCDRAHFSSCAWVKVRLSNGDSKWTILPSLVKRVSLSIAFATKFFFSRSLVARVRWRINSAIVRGTLLGMRQGVVNRYEKYQSD